MVTEIKWLEDRFELFAIHSVIFITLNFLLMPNVLLLEINKNL